MDLPALPRRRLALFATAALLAGGGAMAGMAAMAAASPGHLAVHEVRFLRGAIEGDNLTLDAVLYLTSHERPSREVRLVVWAYPQSGLAEHRLDVSVGVVPGQRTVEVRVPFQLALEGPPWWSLDFLVFEDGLLTQRGQGHVAFREPAPGGTLRGLAEYHLDASAGPFERFP